MSRGPGWIERAIASYFEAEPGRTFSTEELVRLVCHQVDDPQKTHRVAVLRAADNVMVRMPGWVKWKCERGALGRARTTEGRGAVFVNSTDLHSYAIGRLRIDFLHMGESMQRLEGRLLEDERYSKCIAHGGAWWIHVQQNRQKHLGETPDDETSAMIAAYEADWEASIEIMRDKLGVKPEQSERRERRREANAFGLSCASCGEDIAQEDPVVRGRQSENTFGGGRSSSIATKCMKCGNDDRQAGMLLEHDCANCGRRVYEGFRWDRLRSFCSEFCRKRSKNRNHRARGAASRSDDR
jgi:hypothetical protein